MRTKKINEYLVYELACRNQIAIDVNFMNEIGSGCEEKYFAPRPNVWLSRIDNPHNFKAAFLCIALFWRYFGSYVFIFLNWFLTSLKVVLRKDKSQFLVDQTEYVFLAFCNKSLSLALDRTIGFQTGVVVNFAGDAVYDNDVVVYDVSSLYSHKDLLSALFASLKANFLFQKNCNLLNGLESYTAFKWFLYKRVIQKLHANLIIAEHYDRWAVLADACISEWNLKNGSLNYLTIVQHGIISSLSKESDFFSFKLPYKIDNIQYLYVYDVNALSVFEKKVINLNSLTYLKVCFFSPLITLEEVNVVNKSVLLVGHPVVLDFHKFIFLCLYEHDIEVFYKPHPATRQEKLIFNLKWHCISKKDFFPKVDFIISYPSTLIVEYELQGISSFVHPLNIKKNQYEKYKLEILRKIGLEGDL